MENLKHVSGPWEIGEAIDAPGGTALAVVAMTATNGDKPAYPTIDKLITMGVDQGLELKESGLTKREMFAMAAMQGILANPNWKFSEAWAAQNAILEADKLLKALES